MDRSLTAVLSGVVTLIFLIILAGLTLVPLSIAIWLPFLGFVLCCLIIGVVGRLRVLHLMLISFLVYIGLMAFLAINATLLTGITLGPLSLLQIQQAWTAFQGLVNLIPYLSLLSELAAMLRAILGDSLLAIFIEFIVASMLIAFVGLFITGVSGYLTRGPSLHVVAAPEPTFDLPDAFPTTAPPAISESAPAMPAVHTSTSPISPPTIEAPPPLPVPKPVEGTPPPKQQIPKGGAPSAQAISSLKGKVTKHLKGTGQKAPVGQSRCPHCNATVIRGSRFCNACEREI